MDAVLVPEWAWVEPIGADGYRLGVVCAIDRGGRLEEIGRSGDLVLARYHPPDQYGRKGTACHDGQVFFIKADDFDTMAARYSESKKRQDAAADAARRLMREEK